MQYPCQGQIYKDIICYIDKSQELKDFVNQYGELYNLDEECIKSICYKDTTENLSYKSMFYIAYKDSLCPGLSKYQKNKLLTEKYLTPEFRNRDSIRNKIDIEIYNIDKCCLVAFFSNLKDNIIFAQLYFVDKQEIHDYKIFSLNSIVCLNYAFKIENEKIIKYWTYPIIIK